MNPCDFVICDTEPLIIVVGSLALGVFILLKYTEWSEKK